MVVEETRKETLFVDAGATPRQVLPSAKVSSKVIFSVTPAVFEKIPTQSIHLLQFNSHINLLPPNRVVFIIIIYFDKHNIAFHLNKCYNSFIKQVNVFILIFTEVYIYEKCL